MKRLLIALWLIVPVIATAQSVIQIPTVFHVLWNEPNDNIPDSLIFQMLEQVNKDYRRLNDDAYLTPVRFLSVAIDTEIEFVLASSDPNGNATNGITRTFTDSSYFYYLADNMKFDVSGGKDGWLPCAYLNVWIVPEIGLGYAPLVDGVAKHPGTSPEVDGVAIWYANFEDITNGKWRVLTRLLAQYLDLYYISNTSCLDVDSVVDTPISSWLPLGQQYSCDDTIVTCSNGVDGDMFMNFMTDRFEICSNMFTIGQKDRMHTTLNSQRQGLLNSTLCGLAVGDASILQRHLSPNPTTEFLNFQSGSFGNYSVLNVQGRVVKSGTAQSGKNIIDVNELPSGIYLLRLQNAVGVSAKRFVKN